MPAISAGRIQSGTGAISFNAPVTTVSATVSQPVQYAPSPVQTQPVSTNSVPYALLQSVQTAIDFTTNVMSLGAIGDGTSHPAGSVYATLAALQAVYPFATSLTQEIDWLAWQAAFNLGGSVVSPKRHFVMCNSNVDSQQPLMVIAGQSWADGYGAILDWSAMATQTTNTHLITNYNFASSTGWENATIYPSNSISNATFGSGAATCTDGTPASFFQFGQQVTLAPGNYRAILTATATLGNSYNTGDANPPYGIISFFSNSPGDGDNFIGKTATLGNLLNVFTGSVTQTIEMDFNVSTTTTAWFTFSGGGYGNFSITYFDIIPFIANTAIWLTRDGGNEHYPIAMPLRGLEIIGNCRTGYSSDGLSATGPSAILYQSLVQNDGNLISLDSCSINGWGTGIMLRDGAYLTEWRNLIVYSCDIGVSFPGGANAGENFRLYGGGIYNNGYGIHNVGGGEFTLYGTALDYCGKPISYNAGRLELHGVHFENVIANAPLIHCTGSGVVTMFGGQILGVGTVGVAPAPPIQLDSSNSLLTTFGTQLYNIGSTSGVAVGGPGTWRNYGWINSGNQNIQRTSNTLVNDPLGGAGSFEPKTNSPFLGVDPTGIYVPGAVYGPAGATVTNRWTMDYFSVSISTAYAHSGTQSLACAKAALAYNNDYQIVFLLPVQRGQDGGFSFWWRVPTAVQTPLAVTSITATSGIATVTTTAPHGITLLAVTATTGTTNTGNGTIGNVTSGASVVLGAYQIVATSATSFSVTDPASTVLPAATVGTAYTNAEINFTITAGSTAFVAGDKFTVTVSHNQVSVDMAGATQSAYNGIFTVTVTSTTTFTYPVTGSPVSPATGSITWGATASLYVRLFWSQQIGVDNYGRPVFSDANTFKSELDIIMPLSGSSTWTQASYGSEYSPGTTDATTGEGPGAPVWATHLALLLDTESLPAPMTFYIDDLQTYVI